jgi:RNA polymerase sigma-70 factor, ECF subfamily
MAFGAALALVNDFHQAEDVGQEAFVAAWSALPSLADPAAFPGWLHGVVRHQGVPGAAQKDTARAAVAEAERLPSEERWPTAAWSRAGNRRWHGAACPANYRNQRRCSLSNGCSHQDIAVFLGLPVATVNNRQHAAVQS